MALRKHVLIGGITGVGMHGAGTEGYVVHLRGRVTDGPNMVLERPAQVNISPGAAITFGQQLIEYGERAQEENRRIRERIASRKK